MQHSERSHARPAAIAGVDGLLRLARSGGRAGDGGVPERGHRRLVETGGITSGEHRDVLVGKSGFGQNAYGRAPARSVALLDKDCEDAVEDRVGLHTRATW
jgi:hypothetical protein